MGVVNGNVVGVPFDARVLATCNQDRSETIDGTDGGNTHSGSTTLIKTDFARTADKTFLSGFAVDDAASDFGCERFFELLLKVPILRCHAANRNSARLSTSTNHT